MVIYQILSYKQVVDNSAVNTNDTLILFIYLLIIGVQLLYNIVLVYTVQQSESTICIHISPLFLDFLLNLGHHRALSRVPCAIQQVLISYLFYTQYQQCVYVNPNLSIHPTRPPSPLVFISLFSTSVSLFLLCK